MAPRQLPPSTLLRPKANHSATDTETTLLRFGKIQLEHWFSYNDQKPLDDSEFVPLLDMLIDSFAHAGLSAAPVEQLRRHACEVYHRYCQQAAPETTFEENLIELLASSVRARCSASPFASDFSQFGPPRY
jgi:hypothetical protein